MNLHRVLFIWFLVFPHLHAFILKPFSLHSYKTFLHFKSEPLLFFLKCICSSSVQYLTCCRQTSSSTSIQRKSVLTTIIYINNLHFLPGLTNEIIRGHWSMHWAELGGLNGGLKKGAEGEGWKGPWSPGPLLMSGGRLLITSKQEDMRTHSGMHK